MTSSLLRARRTMMRASKQWLDWTGRSGQTYFHHRVAEYREMWQSVARAAGARFTDLAADIWEIEIGSVRMRIRNHELEFDNPVVLGLAGRKCVVHRLLSAEGLSVPEYAEFTLGDLAPALRFLEAHPRGCVVKPSNGYGGQGVTTHVRGPRELRKAALLASLYGHELLIEMQVPGESYRLLVLEGRVVHAVCRRGPRLRADGRATVRGLIDAENARRVRAGDRPLDVDRDCMFTLGYQGLSLEAVPPAGLEVLVKSVNDPVRKYAEVRTVYTDTVTDIVCASIRADAEKAARIVGSDFLGVDVIMSDPSLPLAESGGVINEVNTTPALHHHYEGREAFPAVALQALDAILRRKGAVLVGAR